MPTRNSRAYSFRYRSSNLLVHCHYSKKNPSAASAFIGVSPTELGRALSNLIENGIEARASDTAKVIIRLSEPKANSVCIEVTDFGRGMSPELLSRIGERGVTSGKEKGNGLGIYHARTLVESIGGQFKIESKVGIGTSIFLIFPKIATPSWLATALPAGHNKFTGICT